MTRNLSAILVLLGGGPLAAAAQRIEITPIVGAYVPWTAESRWTTTQCHWTCSTTVTDLDAATTVGVKAAVVTGSLGLEASLTTARPARSTMTSNDVVGPPTTRTSVIRSSVAALRVTKLQALGEAVGVAVAAGVAVTRLPDATLGGPSLGATLHVVMSPRARFEISIVDNIHRAWFRSRGDPAVFGQHNILVAAGLAWVVRS